jgi:hypothetical protein
VQYAKVTIHRDDNVPQTPEDVVVEVEDDVAVPPSSSPPPRADVVPSSSIEIIQWNRKKKAQRSFHSKSSLATSRRGYSPAPQHRVGYRRNVSFRHIRNKSGGESSAKSAGDYSKSQGSIAHLLANDKSSNILTAAPSSIRMSSPVLPAQPAVVRTSDFVASLEQDILVRKIRDNFWEKEARKVSHELSQICEEAFNRSSVSTGHTAVSTETTATSISIYEEAARMSEAGESSETLDKIADLPASYTMKELAETRRKLIEHSTKAEAAGLPDYLCEVIAHLDRLIEQDIARSKAKSEFVAENSNRRTLSEQLTKHVVDTGYLPSISEEMFTPLETSSGYDLQRVDHHATPEPSPRVSQNLEAKSTIRVVPKDSSLPSIEDIKPLTIRKRSAVAEASSLISKSRHSSADSVIHIRKQPVPSEQRTSSDSVATSLRYNSRRPMVLETISESSDSRRSSAKSSNEKKWSWFGKHKSYIHEENAQEATLPSAKTAPASLVSNTEAPIDTEERKISRKASGEKSRSSFLKIFSKKKTEKMDSDSLTGKQMSRIETIGILRQHRRLGT